MRNAYNRDFIKLGNAEFLTFHVLAPQKSSFSTGFIRVFDMAKCQVRFIYKRNAFLIILEAFLRFRLENHKIDTGFIRVFATRFWLLRNLVFRWFYEVF